MSQETLIPDGFDAVEKNVSGLQFMAKETDRPFGD
jgi:hypothetical protein